MSPSSNKSSAFTGYKDIVQRVRTALSYMRIFLIRDHYVNLSSRKVSVTEVIDASIGMSYREMKSIIKMETMVKLWVFLECQDRWRRQSHVLITSVASALKA